MPVIPAFLGEDRSEIQIILGLNHMRPCLKTWGGGQHKKLLDKIKLLRNYSISLYVLCEKVLLGTFSVCHSWRQVLIPAFYAWASASFGFWAYFPLNVFSGKETVPNRIASIVKNGDWSPSEKAGQKTCWLGSPLQSSWAV